MELIDHDRKYNRRLLMQMKMIEVYKFIESKKQNHDIGWQGAMEGWVSSGLAKKFAEVFTETITIKEMKSKMFETN